MRNRKTADREFYRTPKEAVLLAGNIMNNVQWWECCAGDGSISNVLPKITYASDIHPLAEGIDTLDVLTCPKPNNIDAVITNPPFTLAQNILDRCLFEWDIPVLLLVRIEPFCTVKRKKYADLISDMHIVTNLIRFETEDGRIVNGNGTMRCAWMLFKPNHVGGCNTKWVGW
tara:strand:+ start:163 stop:678 length:516 start_codon:yes stop_codon:yes gene_type:complete